MTTKIDEIVIRFRTLTGYTYECSEMTDGGHWHETWNNMVKQGYVHCQPVTGTTRECVVPITAIESAWEAK